MIRTLETSITEFLASYLKRQRGFSLDLKYFPKAETGQFQTPCVVIKAEEVERQHPRVVKLEVNLDLFVQMDDTDPELASEAARGLFSQMRRAWEELGQEFSQRGEFQLRKVRPLTVGSQEEGERSRYWGQLWEIWIFDFSSC